MEQNRIYKARLDFYYKLIVIYFMFLALYVIMRGSFGAKEFTIVFHDPIIYITGLFILYSVMVLIVNAVRGKEIEFLQDRLIIKNRFGKREITFAEVINIRYSRERKRRTEVKSSVRRVAIKLKDRKKVLRIRLSEFYDERKLLSEFQKISKQ
ncbi:MAG: hypothetical protein ACOYN6_01775 [Ignavibacteria bacterium]